MSQQALGRRWAPSIAGSPQIRSVPGLGWVKVRRSGRATVDSDMPDELKKRHVKQAFEKFVGWMDREDGAIWDGTLPEIQGPLPHFAIHEPDVQYGDNGGSRPVARSVERDHTDTGKEDYIIIASFWTREKITEVRTSVAEELFATGKPGVRPLREKA